jgi:energy-coupling factor transporter ATP-binding protein EcfA2
VLEADAARAGGIRLEVRELTYAYPGHPPALQGVDLILEPGTYLALVGQNGAGKTTLAKHLNGLLRPTGGQVLVDGEDAGRLSVGRLAHKVGYVFQNPDHQIFADSVVDEIRFGPRNLGLSEEVVATRVERALEAFGLQTLAGERPATLGFGLRRKIGLASVLAMDTPALILDEPTTGLDWPATESLMSAVGDLAESGRTIVVITHDTRLVANFVPECAVLHAGKLVARGPTAAVLREASYSAQMGLDLPQIGQLARRLGWTGDDLALTVPQFVEVYAGQRALRRDKGR